MKWINIQETSLTPDPDKDYVVIAYDDSGKDPSVEMARYYSWGSWGISSCTSAHKNVKYWCKLPELPVGVVLEE